MGDGMSFTITPNPGLGNSGGWLGTSPNLYPNLLLWFRLSDSYIGLDANITHIVEPAPTPFSMKEEVPFSVWLDYDGILFKVYIAQNSTIRPTSPTLSTSYNISNILMPTSSTAGYYMGFTSGTGWLTADFNILSWCFNAGQCTKMHGMARCCSVAVWS